MIAQLIAPNMASRTSTGMICTRSLGSAPGLSWGSRRVFRQFVWLEVGSDKMALSRPTHQRVTHTVWPLGLK